MKRFLIFIIFILVAIPVSAEQIYSLIQEGRIKEAQEKLSRLTTAAVRNGDVLFYQALLETDAAKAAELMEAALNSSVSIKYQQEIYYRLAQYYLLNENFDRLSRLVIEYRAKWENGHYEREFLRFSIIADQMRREYESALKQADRYLLKWPDGEMAQPGMIDKARIMDAYHKNIGADRMLRQLSREKRGEGVPQAIYMLTRDAIRHKRTDDAVFYYNLLREGYPGAVGLDALIDDLSEIADRREEDNTAEKITGTFYSVKVGVFSNNDNAKDMADRFKDYGKKIEIKDKTISGKKYRVVYVGHFSSYLDASQFKDQLESTYNEVYQVVAR